MAFLWYSAEFPRPAQPHFLSMRSYWQDDGFGNCICTFDMLAWEFAIHITTEDLH